MFKQSALCQPASLALGLIACSLACTSGSGSHSGTHTLPPSTGLVPLCISATHTQDWEGIDIKIQSIALTPQDGGSPVTLLAAPGAGLPINLAQLDQLSELLGSYSVPVGTYTSATMTLATGDGDIALYTSSLPSPGFPTAGLSNFQVSSFDLYVENDGGNATVSEPIPLVKPLVVTTEQNEILDLDFNLSEPTFLSSAAYTSNVRWTINFDHVLRHKPIHDITQLSLSPVQGVVFSVAADGRSLTLTPSFPAGLFGPVVMPQTFQIKADAINGSVFYDVDAKTRQVLTDFSSVANLLPGTFICLSPRLQPDGSLAASRIWNGVGSTMGTEVNGHITSIRASENRLTMDGDMTGPGIGLTGIGFGYGPQLNDQTEISFWNPADPAASVGTIGTSADLLNAHDLVRGFLIHGLQDFDFTPPGNISARYIGIESANFTGAISNANGQGFTCAYQTSDATTDFSVDLPYISSTTLNDKDDAGTPIHGFEWWAFDHPDQVHSGPEAVSSFVNASQASVDFGGTAGVLRLWATHHATWGDAANPDGWNIRWSTLEPTPLPDATIAGPWVPSAGGGSFGITIPNGTNMVQVDVLSDASEGTRVYMVELGPLDGSWQTAVVHQPVDITTPNGLALLVDRLTYYTQVDYAQVRIYGIPQANGHLKASTLYLIHR